MTATRVLLFGASGRMGKVCIGEIAAADDMELAAGICSPASTATTELDMGTAAGLARPLGRNFQSEAPPDDAWDLVIDFSLPQAQLQSVQWALRAGKPAVIGVTGLSAEQMRQMHEAAAEIPLLFSANFTAGMALIGWVAQSLRQLAEQAGAPLAAEISEIHHADKRDKPSGTALKLAERLDVEPGLVQAERTAAIGDECEHRVRVELQGEKIELVHRASRRCFAAGALQAARWLRQRAPGFYSMEDAVRQSPAPTDRGAAEA